MNSVLHKAATRGHANHGWLDARHTFSFANYHNPVRMNFGVLRVLNNDIIAGGKGFGTHPHDNMEIITIPISGDLKHEDNMGNAAVIREGDIQVMSAGTGVRHSEYNNNPDKAIELLQIWLFPDKRNVEPRYEQISLDESSLKNQFKQILSPNPDDDGVWIHQNAWFNLGELKKGQETTYNIQGKGNGVYAFLIDGAATINGQQLEKRDGFGVWDTDKIDVTIQEDAKILLMEVPMSINKK